MSTLSFWGELFLRHAFLAIKRAHALVLQITLHDSFKYSHPVNVVFERVTSTNIHATSLATKMSVHTLSALGFSQQLFVNILKSKEDFFSA